MVNEFAAADVEHQREFTFTADGNQTAIPPLRVTGEGILNEFGFNYHAFWRDIWALAALAGAYSFCSYVMLALSDRQIT